MTNDNASTPGRRVPGRAARRGRWLPLAAGATAAALTAAAVASAGGGSAGAATAPNAQSAGNFVDATIGGNPIDDIAKLAFARAQNPGNVTDQNPLDVTVLNTIHLPLTGALQLPQLLGITLGAANQVAFAKSDGASYGASGAVLNSGGVSIGGNNSSRPADATIELTASGLSGAPTIPIPGGNPADALGGVTAQIGAVASIARTPQFGPPLASSWLDTCTQSDPTCYEIASLNLSLGSPALGQLFAQLASQGQALVDLLAPIATQLGAAFPNSCSFNVGQLPGTISLDNGAVVIDSSNATLTIDLQKLLKTLGLNINDLPPNTDLLRFVLLHLGDILSTGLENVVNGIVNPLQTEFGTCLQDLGALGTLLQSVLTALQTGGQQIEDALNQIASTLSDAGASGMGALADGLAKLLDIGVNVRPQLSSGTFDTNLNTLPKQGMTPPPVPYQYTVRAIEVQLLGTSGVTLALANSAAGPSSPTILCCAPPPTHSTTPPPTNIPTGVPAGAGSTGGGPLLPIVLLALGLMFAGGGVFAYRMRGTLNRH